MGPPASHQIPRAWCYSGAISVYALFRLRDLYPLRCVFPNLFDYRSYVLSDGPQPRIVNYPVWPLSLSLAATQKITQLCSAALLVFSSCGYLDVSVPHVPPAKLFIHLAVTGLFPAGFPHSDISGSLTVCVSPLLFAAFRVLLRLLVARLPPYALLRLISLSSSAALAASDS